MNIYCRSFDSDTRYSGGTELVIQRFVRWTALFVLETVPSAVNGR
jgi:hypothetical protein